MAKIKLGDAIGAYEWLENSYHGQSLKLDDKSKEDVTFTDKNDYSIEFSGTDLKFKGDKIVDGKIKTAEFLNAEGGVLLSITKLSINAEAIQSALKNGGFFDLMSLLGSKNDTITGSEQGDDLFIGWNTGNDVINARGGDDWVKGSAGDNIMDGGEGYDHLWYQDSYFDKAAKKGIVLDIDKGTAKNSWGGKDEFSNFEEYRGSKFDDKMLGGDGDDTLHGLGGKDILDGRGGYDILRYFADEEFGGKKGIVVDFDKGTVKDGFGKTDSFKNIEEVSGTRKADSFKGDEGDNVFSGFDGKDTYDGKGGMDVLSLWHWGDDQHGAKVDLTLATGQVIDDGYGNTETLKNVEAVIGTDFDDEIKFGSAAGAWVDGRGGDDRIVASAAENYLTGGTGADTFVFGDAAASPAGTIIRDLIEDFSQADGDQIDISGLGSLEFAGEGELSGEAAEIVFSFSNGKTFVSADTDADGNADLQFLLTGEINLQETDFILA